MKFGLYGLHKGENAEPGALARRARMAEEAGFESLWVGDHIALPADAPDDPREPRLEAVVALAHLAAVTERVRLGFGVIVLPQRQPVLLAKQIASVDVLSRGRVIVGLGAGYVEAELNALGASLRERGARTDEHIAAMKALWDEPVPAFEGRFVSFAGVMQRPRPVQRPHPPIVLGGESPRALRRAAETGSGWYGWEQTPDEAADTIRKLGRELEITITPPQGLDRDTVRAYEAAGVDRLVVQPPESTGAATEALIEQVRALL
jgi:probable F420-dependent oxidoreductase